MAIVFAYTKSTNVAVVTGGTTGTPATFADFVTADRAGSVTLRAATAGLSPTLALTYQITPVELRALIISFVVASKTTETDYIFVTGTDFRAGAQTESIDVSAGNGTYASTKYFHTITNIDCSDNANGGGTQWANGTVAVTQPQWGVIWNLGNGQYTVDAKFDIGDGSTSTFFTTKSESTVFTVAIPRALAATFTIGEPSNTTNSKSCCYMKFPSGSSGRQFQSYGTVQIYGSIIEWTTNQLWYGANGIFNVSNSIFNGNGQGLVESTNGGVTQNWSNVYITNVDQFALQSNPATFNNVQVENATTYGLDVVGGVTVTAVGLNMTNSNPQVRTNGTGTRVHVRDPGFTLVTANLNIVVAENIIFEEFTCNINVTDSYGNALQGVVVDCVDATGAAVWTAGTVSTDASGNITQQVITTRSWTTTSETLTTYTPHVFTFKKANYRTLVMKNITTSIPIKWKIELQSAEGGIIKGVMG